MLRALSLWTPTKNTVKGNCLDRETLASDIVIRRVNARVQYTACSMTM